MKDKNGHFYSNAKWKVTAKETSREVSIDIPEDEVGNVTAGLLKKNHLRGLYNNYCIVNQDFLSYVISCKLTKTQYGLLLYIISRMDKENKVLLNNFILMKAVGGTEKTIINSIQKLTEKGIIVRQKFDVSKYEYQINYDILNPEFAFKNKSSLENVEKHKNLMRQETPYLKQYNTEGTIDLVDKDSGEIFRTIKR